MGALILNVVSSQLGFTNWYEFLKNPSGANVLSYIWLFIGYPLGLGFVAVLANRFARVL